MIAKEPSTIAIYFSQRTSKGEVEDGGVVLVGGEDHQQYQQLHIQIEKVHHHPLPVIIQTKQQQ